MNTKNFEFLRDGLKFLGFKDTLNPKLEENINAAPTAFQLKTSHEYGKDKVDYTLDFKKSDTTDMYFFNKYNATLSKDGQPDKSQNFYINKNTGVTAKEAFNLLDGRAVNKDLINIEKQPYNAWLQLDFKEKDKNDNFKVKQFSQGYGYDLDKSLSKYPIKELSDPELKERMTRSLERGNVHQVNFVKDGGEEKMNIQANPQFKNIIVYDASMKKQYQENDKSSSVSERPAMTVDKKEAAKESVKTAADDDGPARKTKKKGMSV